MTAHQLPPVSARRRIEGFGKEALETGRNRLLVTAAVLTLAFVGIGARLVDLSVLNGTEPAQQTTQDISGPALVRRADIVDRNGVVLASSLPTASLYADPAEVLDAELAAAKIATVFDDIDPAVLAKKLASGGRFLWIKRNLSPEQQLAANRLGIPGFDFIREERRIYPLGNLTAHVLGATDVDGNGISGIEGFFDARLRRGDAPLPLAIDVRVQSILRTELAAAMTEFKALGAAGVVIDVRTGETLGLVSLPDFDPNDRTHYDPEERFNRVTKGVYEMGSTFKLFTAAMALDTGTVKMSGGYDATDPIRISRFTISDFHAQKRWLTLPEIIVHSSNIGAAKMAVDVGTPGQRDYLKRFGLLQDSALEIPEIGHPLMPDHWREINAMTISFGHGIAVSPLQLASGIAALVNGGVHRPATLLRHARGAPANGTQVISAATSEKIRQLMRLVVAKGTGRKAEAEGYFVGGKTGTAEKQVAGRYKKSAKISSFVGAFPIQDPRYVVFAMLDEPEGNKRTFNYATGGWVAAPVVSRVVAQIGPLLGVQPRVAETEPLDLPLIDDERQKNITRTKALVKNVSVTTQPKPADEVVRAPPVAKKATSPPLDETPSDRIARKTREALEQAFAVQ